MFVTYLGAIFTTLITILGAYSGFNLQISLMAMVYRFFCQFFQRHRRKQRQSASCQFKENQTETFAKKMVEWKRNTSSGNRLEKRGCHCLQLGDVIPADGEVIEGIATVDESAITGESAPVIRDSGGDRSAVTAGTRIVSDRIVIRVTSEKGHSFLDRMVALIEGAQRQKTPNEIALNIVLSSLTIIFILTVMSVKTFADYSGRAAQQDLSDIVTVPVLIALLVCLIPTTISALLSCDRDSRDGSFNPAECHCQKRKVGGGCRGYRPVDFR